MSSELARIDPTAAWGVAKQMGDAAAHAGQYGSKNAAELAIRIQYGVELGMGPAAALMSVQVVQGKPTLTAPAVAGRIKASGRYNYRVTDHTDESCRIVFYEAGEEIGDSVFTMKDAQQAGLLSNATWKKYPRNMLFARALTNGARWHCPDVFGGAIYTPDELGGPLPDDEGIVVGEVVEERELTAADRIKQAPRDVVAVIREVYPDVTADMDDEAIKAKIRAQGYRTLDSIRDGASNLLRTFPVFLGDATPDHAVVMDAAPKPGKAANVMDAAPDEAGDLTTAVQETFDATQEAAA